MCCKLLGIQELAKPRLTWCSHCKIGAGCGIYADRPQECADFYCAWLVNASLGPEWRPVDAKMVISFDTSANRVVVHVDPARGDAWRKAPHYAQIKRMAAQALSRQGHLLVWQGYNAFVVLPDKDVNLGAIDVNAIIVVSEDRTAQGASYNAAAYAPDDPKLAAMGYTA